jgi:thiamine-phosphate pyrophosphorylase
MNSRKKLLKGLRLYVIIDKETLKNTPVAFAAHKAIACGVKLLQLRDKISPKKIILENARAICKFKKRSLVIINDHPDIACVVNCDGVHLGQDDLPIKEARKLLGRDKLIGISCHSLKHALTAQENGADYIGIGPIFSTPTKPGRGPIGLNILKNLKNKIKIPYFAIGGINLNNLEIVKAAGAKRIAVCREILRAADMKYTISVITNKLKADS